MKKLESVLYKLVKLTFYGVVQHPMNKKLLYLCILLVTSVIVRLFYAATHPAPIINADSYGYYGFGKQLVERPALSSFVNQYRVPVYSTILSGLMALNGKTSVPLDAPAFRPVLSQLLFIQGGLAVLSIALIYSLLIQLSIPVVWSFVISLFFSLNVYAYPLERAVMTDSLASTLLIGLIYLLVQLVQKPTQRKYILFGVLSAVSWLLRPNLLLVPLLSLPLVLFVKANKKFLVLNLQIFFVSLLLPITFVFLNSQYHGYAGISQINEINLLGRILEFNLPVEAGKQYTTYYQAVADNRKNNGPTMPYRFIDLYAPLTYVDTKLMSELQQFDRVVIANNLLSYITQAFSYIPKIFSDDPPLLALDTKATTGIAGFFAQLWNVSQAVWQLGYLVFILWPVSVWFYFTKPKASRMVPVILGATSVSQLLIIVFFDYYDMGQYARLASVIQPQTYLFFVLMVREYIVSRGDTI